MGVVLQKGADSPERETRGDQNTKGSGGEHDATEPRTEEPAQAAAFAWGNAAAGA